MQTKIFYFGINEMALEYLNGEKFKTRMNKANLEPELVTKQTAVMTATSFNRDSYGTLLLVNKHWKDTWLSKGKDHLYPEGKAFTIDEFEELEPVLQKVYGLPYDEENSAINLMNVGSSKPSVFDKMSQEGNPAGAGLGGTDDAFTTSDEENSIPPVEDEKPGNQTETKPQQAETQPQQTETKPQQAETQPQQTETKPQQTETHESPNSEVAEQAEKELGKNVANDIEAFFSDKRDENVSMKKGTEIYNPQAFLYGSLSDSIPRKLVKTNKNQFTLKTYEDTGSVGVEQVLAVEGYEVTSDREVKNLEEYRKKIRELTEDIQNLNKKFAQYKSPEQIEELADSYSKLDDEYADLSDKYSSIIANGDPNTKKKLEDSEKEINSMRVQLEKYKSDNENLYSNNKKVLNDLKTAREANKRLQIEFDEYRDKDKSGEKPEDERDYDTVVQGNIELASTNQELRKSNEDLSRELKEAERTKLELQKGISGSSVVGYAHVPENKRYGNTTIYVSVNSSAQLHFYKDILTSSEYITGKVWLVDLGKTSKIELSYDLSTVANPNKVLRGEKQLRDSLNRSTNKIDGSKIELLTSVIHGIGRDTFAEAQWDKFLDQLNMDKSLLYLGNLEDNSVFELVRRLTVQDNNVRVIVILGDESGVSNLVNLQGLSYKKLFFAGLEGTNYNSKIRVQLRYQNKSI